MAGVWAESSWRWHVRGEGFEWAPWVSSLSTRAVTIPEIRRYELVISFPRTPKWGTV